MFQFFETLWSGDCAIVIWRPTASFPNTENAFLMLSRYPETQTNLSARSPTTAALPTIRILPGTFAAGSVIHQAPTGEIMPSPGAHRSAESASLGHGV